VIALLWGQFIRWISPFLVPLLGALLLIACLIAGWQTVRINGIWFNMPVTHWKIYLVRGLIDQAKDAKADYAQCKENRGKLEVAIKTQNEQIAAWRKAGLLHDKNTQGEVDSLKPALDKAIADGARLRSMVGNLKYGKDACTRAQAIINAEISP
jgi:hypothetical protein